MYRQLAHNHVKSFCYEIGVNLKRWKIGFEFYGGCFRFDFLCFVFDFEILNYNL